jgi:hypothetical protein
MEPPTRAEVERALEATALGIALGAALALLRRRTESEGSERGRPRADRAGAS